jgi:hypothetical protein
LSQFVTKNVWHNTHPSPHPTFPTTTPHHPTHHPPTTQFPFSQINVATVTNIVYGPTLPSCHLSSNFPTDFSFKSHTCHTPPFLRAVTYFSEAPIFQDFSSWNHKLTSPLHPHSTLPQRFIHLHDSQHTWQHFNTSPRQPMWKQSEIEWTPQNVGSDSTSAPRIHGTQRSATNWWI